MHEVSLVKSLLQQVTDIAKQHKAGSVREIRIEIGPLSGVEKVLVHEAYMQLAARYVGSECRLVIEEIPLQGKCETCGKSIVIQDFQFRCPACGSSDVNITGGDAFRLLDISIDTSMPWEMMEQV